MPRYTKEQAAAILNDIDKHVSPELNTSGANNIKLSDHPELRKMQQAVILYRINQLPPRDRDVEVNLKKIYQNVANMSDPLMDLYSTNQTAVDSIVFDLVECNDTNSVYDTVTKTVEKPETWDSGQKTRELYFRALFLPTPSGERIAYMSDSDAKDNENTGTLVAELKEAYTKIAAINAPSNISEEDAGLVVFSTLIASPDTLRKIDAKTKGDEAKNLAFVVETDPVVGGFTTLFTGLMEGNGRANQQIPRLFIPEKRTEAEKLLSEYGKGNYKPVAKVLQQAAKNLIHNYVWAMNSENDLSYKNSAVMLTRIMDLAQREEFRKFNLFTEEELNRVSAIRKNIELNQEYAQTLNSLRQRIFDGAASGRDQAFGDDPQNVADLKRLMTLKWHFLNKKEARDLFGTKDERPETSFEYNAVNYEKEYTDVVQKHIEAQLENSDAFKKILESRLNDSEPNHGIDLILKNIDSVDKASFNSATDPLKVKEATLGSSILSKAETRIGNFTQYEKNVLVTEARKVLAFCTKDYVGSDEATEKFNVLTDKIVEVFSENKLPGEYPSKQEIQDRIRVLTDLREKVDEISGDIYESNPFDIGNGQFDDDRNYFLTDFSKALNLACAAYAKGLDQPDLNAELRDIPFNALVDSLEKSDKILVLKSGSDTLDRKAATEAVRNGKSISIQTFEKGSPAGQSIEVSLSDGNIKTGKPQIAVRECDMKADMQRPFKAAAQLDKLDQIRSMLSKSNPWYMSNSKQFNNAMKALDRVIKQQKSIGENPNIFETEKLKNLYTEMADAFKAYTDVKADKLKLRPDDRVGDLRFKLISSLATLADNDHVETMLYDSYPERKQYVTQIKAADKLRSELQELFYNMDNDLFDKTVADNCNKLAEFYQSLPEKKDGTIDLDKCKYAIRDLSQEIVNGLVESERLGSNHPVHVMIKRLNDLNKQCYDMFSEMQRNTLEAAAKDAVNSPLAKAEKLQNPQINELNMR